MNLMNLMKNIGLLRNLSYVPSQQYKMVIYTYIFTLFTVYVQLVYLKCMRNDFSLLISLLQSEDKAKINIFQ